MIWEDFLRNSSPLSGKKKKIWRPREYLGIRMTYRSGGEVVFKGGQIETGILQAHGGFWKRDEPFSFFSCRIFGNIGIVFCMLGCIGTALYIILSCNST